MEEGLISVIVPIYNSDKYLDKCINSFLNQTDINIEVVLVDDGSTDRSSQICNDFAGRDKRVKVVHIPNGGVSNARNIGITHCCGDIVYFIDSDDLPIENEFVRCAKLMRKTNCDLLLAGFLLTDMNLHAYKRNIYEGFHKNMSPEMICELYMRGEIPTCIGAFLVKKDIAEKIKFPPHIRYGEDVVYICKCIVESKEICLDSGAICCYRQNEMSAIHKLDLSRFDNYYTRMDFRMYLEENHPEYTKLLNFVDDFHIPEALFDDIRLMCLKGSSFQQLRRFLKDHDIEREILHVINRDTAESSFRKELVRWKKNPARYFMSYRIQHWNYELRSFWGRIKRRLLRSG